MSNIFRENVFQAFQLHFHSTKHHRTRTTFQDEHRSFLQAGRCALFLFYSSQFVYISLSQELLTVRCISQSLHLQWNMHFYNLSHEVCRVEQCKIDQKPDFGVWEGFQESISRKKHVQFAMFRKLDGTWNRISPKSCLLQRNTSKFLANVRCATERPFLCEKLSHNQLYSTETSDATSQHSLLSVMLRSKCHRQRTEDFLFLTVTTIILFQVASDIFW